MILLDNRPYLQKLCYYCEYKAIVIITLCFYFSFFFITCSSLRYPRSNILINNSNWVRQPCKKLLFNSKYANLFLYAEQFSQGKAVYIEILPLPVKNKDDPSKGRRLEELDMIRLSIKNKETSVVILKYMGWGYRGFWGIHPNASSGKYSVTLAYLCKGEKVNMTYSIDIFQTEFPVFKKTRKLDLAKYSDVDQVKQKAVHDFIMRSFKKKKNMFTTFSESKIENEISHPRDAHYITSDFWTKRIYIRYKVTPKGKKVYLKPKVKIHRGLDFRGAVGTPIYAMAAGKVVIADKLYYEGNFTLIDHGDRIFSGYMHQNKIFVDEGDEVDAGEEIGSVGVTGRVTGPHLHVLFKINGVYVDPLSMITLPIRY